MISKEDYKNYLEQWQSLMTSSIFQTLLLKHNLLPLVSTISVAMLALLSLNKELISNPSLFKSSMIIFIITIPLSLWLSFLEINSGLNSFVKSKPMSQNDFNRNEAEKRIERAENSLSAVRTIKLIFKNLRDKDYKNFRKNLWELFLGLSQFFLIVLITIAFILLILSLFYKNSEMRFPMDTPILKKP